MRTTVVTPTQTGSELGASDSLMTSKSSSPAVVEVLDNAAVTAGTPEDESAHMRRRLFRTLDHPDRSLIAIDCGSTSPEKIREITDHFFADLATREQHNLVLAIPTDNEFANSPTFDFVQSIKEQAFESQLDGKVSWLLIHEATSELPALANLVQQQGGQWHCS